MNAQEKKVFFSSLLALLPFFSSFISPIPNVDLGTFLLFVFFILALPKRFYLGDLLLLLFYVLYITPFTWLLLSDQYTSNTVIFFRCLKFIFILGCVFGFGFHTKYYSEEVAFKTMRYLMYTCAIFIIIQRVFFSFSIVIENPLLRFATYDEYRDGYSMGTAFLFRPSAFFLEPSHLSIYGLVLLVYLLFKKDNLMQSLIVFITLLCSGSGIGLVFSVMIYSLYFLFRIRKHADKVFILVIIGLVGAFFMSKMSFFQNVVSRLTTDNIMGGGNAVIGRLGIEGYQLFFEKNLLLQLFGSGYGNVPADIYLNGITYILNTLGVFGCIIFFLQVLRYIHKGETWQKIGLIIVLGLSIGSQVFTPTNLVFYFCIYNGQLVLDRSMARKKA